MGIDCHFTTPAGKSLSELSTSLKSGLFQLGPLGTLAQETSTLLIYKERSIERNRNVFRAWNEHSFVTLQYRSDVFVLQWCDRCHTIRIYVTSGGTLPGELFLSGYLHNLTKKKLDTIMRFSILFLYNMWVGPNRNSVGCYALRGQHLGHCGAPGTA